MKLSIQNTLKRKGRRISNFLKNDIKTKASKALSPAIYLEEWARHFKHKYLIKISENLVEPCKTNE